MHAASSWITIARNFSIATAALVATAIAVSAFALSTIGPLASLIALGIAIAAAAFLTGIYAHRGLARSRNTPLGYRIEETTYTYIVSGTDIRSHTRVLTERITAKRDSVDLVEGRYRWTGAGEVMHEPADPNHQVVEFQLIPEDEGWKRYLIRFPPLTRNGSIEISSKLHLVDDGSMRPYFRRTIRDYVPKLTIIVQLPPRFIEQSSIKAKHEFRRPGQVKPIGDLGVSYAPDTGLAQVVIEDPIVGHTYGIEWAWPTYQALIQRGEVNWTGRGG